MPEGQFLLDRTEILNTKDTKIEKDVFESFIRQKPNRKMFRYIHFFVWWYNQFDQDMISRNKAARNEKYEKYNAAKLKKYEAINAKREEKGKKTRTPKLKDKESPTLLESVRDIGEEPVLLDSGLTEQTRQQLSKFLFSKGFFNNRVKDTIIIERRRKKAVVRYMIQPNAPYKIQTVTYQMDDPKLGEILCKDSINSLLERGANYDTELLARERQRLANLALNNGYYYFEVAYLNFDVDSAHANRSVSIHVHLKKFARAYSANNDSLILVNHPRFKIENIYVIPEPTLGNLQESVFKDTLQGKRSDVFFLLNKPIPFRTTIFTTNIDIRKGQYFKKDTAEITYKALLGLGMFKNITIQFYKNPENNSTLDCYIVCNPMLKQSLTAETEGINTSGNLGVDGSLVYQNRNFFRGGELVELKLQGALIAQQQFSEKNTAADISNIQKTFNTLQFGPEVTFSVPRALLPFSLLPFRKEMAPHTFVRASLSYQSRSEFLRVISNIDYGFNFNTHNNRFRHELIPLEVYLVNATLTKQFNENLQSLNDAFLLNSFLDHITTLSKYSLTYNSKENSNTSKRPVNYFRVSVCSSGNILRQYNKITNEKADTAGRFLLFHIPFAQFVKADVDYRLYVPIRNKSRLVYRVAGGLGKPQANLQVLPYEQSFFSGGPNSIRAWRARTLGPGAYDPSESSSKYDKIGDMLLEGNVEYRFHIIKSLNGALFADAGNIWKLNKDPAKPGGEFKVDKFWEEIALGGGIGIRWDLNFFVLRFDFAAPLRDPKYPSGARWNFGRQPWKQTVVNFGIGYPF